MTTINQLLLSARYELGDIAGDTFSDYVLMDQYNKGNKLLRKTIMDTLPMQLSEEVTGTVLTAGSITMPKKPIKFIDVRVNGNILNKVSVTEIDKTATGEPKGYYLLGTTTVKLYPIPDKSYDYEIIYIAESATMADTEDSGYQTDVETLLVRYIVGVLSGKGFDLVAEYNATIGQMLGDMETGVTMINGYTYPCGRRDYY